jgi:hypothetical protein
MGTDLLGVGDSDVASGRVDVTAGVLAMLDLTGVPLRIR